MLGLFGNLSVASRALQAQAQSMEVAGQNLANVNNPAYARQRVTLQTSAPIPDATVGLQGSGADVAAIDQIRDSLLDDQIRVETSVLSFSVFFRCTVTSGTANDAGLPV